MCPSGSLISLVLRLDTHGSVGLRVSLLVGLKSVHKLLHVSAAEKRLE